MPKTFHGRIPVFLSRLDPHFQMLIQKAVSSIDAKILFSIISLKNVTEKNKKRQRQPGDDI